MAKRSKEEREEERKKELKDCFSPLSGAQNLRLAIVDDIFTSGATTKEAARSLFQAGYEEFYILIIAK